MITTENISYLFDLYILVKLAIIYYITYYNRIVAFNCCPLLVENIFEKTQYIIEIVHVKNRDVLGNSYVGGGGIKIFKHKSNNENVIMHFFMARIKEKYERAMAPGL